MARHDQRTWINLNCIRSLVKGQLFSVLERNDSENDTDEKGRDKIHGKTGEKDENEVHDTGQPFEDTKNLDQADVTFCVTFPSTILNEAKAKEEEEKSHTERRG